MEIGNIRRMYKFSCLVRTARTSDSFLTYPRHRWTGIDTAESQFALLAVVGYNGRRGAYLSGLGERVTLGKRATPACGDAADASAPRTDEGCDKDEGHANASCVRTASAWFCSKPRADTIAIRTVMEPWRLAMARLCAVSGEQWDEQPAHKEATHTVSPEEPTLAIQNIQLV